MSLDYETRAVRQAVRDGVSHYRTQLVEQLDAADLSEWLAHRTRTDNPHQTTRHQVGLDQLQNYPIADGVQVETGVSETHYIQVAHLLVAVDRDAFVQVSQVRPPKSLNPEQFLTNETLVEMSAAPFASTEAALVFLEREYRFTGGGVELTHTASTEDVASLDITQLSSGVYLWQCRDRTTTGVVSPWSYPAWVGIQREAV